MLILWHAFFRGHFRTRLAKRKKMSHFRKMEIVGLAEKTRIIFFVDIWGPEISASGGGHFGRAKMGRGIKK